MLSGCTDAQTSADVAGAGALSHAFAAAMDADPHPTYGRLLGGLRDALRAQLGPKCQMPCLSSSHSFDLADEFTLGCGTKERAQQSRALDGALVEAEARRGEAAGLKAEADKLRRERDRLRHKVQELQEGFPPAPGGPRTRGLPDVSGSGPDAESSSLRARVRDLEADVAEQAAALEQQRDVVVQQRAVLEAQRVELDERRAEVDHYSREVEHTARVHASAVHESRARESSQHGEQLRHDDAAAAHHDAHVAALQRQQRDEQQLGAADTVAELHTALRQRDAELRDAQQRLRGAS
eukprot:gene40832-26864_t